MLVLLLVAFLSGLLTIFAPCIWPLLPVVLSTSTSGGSRRPLGVTLGILISFFGFTLGLSYLVKIFGFNPSALRYLAVLVLFFLGLTLLIPPLSAFLEGLSSRLSGLLGRNSNKNQGFRGGIVLGLSLGLVWTPCAGPILATIATLAATRTVTSQLLLVTIIYLIGMGIPLFLFVTFGSKLLTQSRLLSPFTGKLQQIFGVILLITALSLWTGNDLVIETKLLNYFPGYSTLLYKIENIDQVQNQLNVLKGHPYTSSTPSTSYLPDMGPAPEIVGIDHWLNSSPLTLNSLKGKVVLVDFWTYSCINCLRTLPFVEGWYQKYHTSGLEVIGIHTPEFEFEKDTVNVQKALSMNHITYPVAQDNSYSTWNNYNNSYWPAKYLIDKNGHLRLTHFGEGNYPETEMAIQSLLAETGATISATTLNLVDQTPTTPLTPETYLGLNRLGAFASPERPQIGSNKFTFPSNLSLHQFAYSGDWLVTGEYAESTLTSSLELNFHASKVYLVITPSQPGDSLNIILDGKLTKKLLLDVPRLYEIINLPGSIGDHLLHLDFNNKGIRVFAFTFG